MATTYTCDNCGATAPTLDNWYTIQLGFFSEGPAAPPPGSRSFNGATPTLIFHELACRQAWCEQAGVTDPGEASYEPSKSTNS
jgi:hypothetical protein